MTTVTLGLSGPGEARKRLALAFEGKAQGVFISFETPGLLWKALSEKRWEILSAMTGAGPMAIREVARRVGRDVKAVHGDVTALILAGVIERAAGGGVVFPYDAVHVDFRLTTAA